jgi:protein-S-isoprenylcysteine O-methyltransferase Ste14
VKLNVIKALVFTILVPVLIVGGGSFALIQVWSQEIELGFYKYLGLPFVIFGVLFYFSTTLSFLYKGKGTPAIFFSKPFKFLVGEEPKEFVSSDLYKFSRNPMYLGVVMQVFGLGVIFESISLVVYSFLLWLIFHIVVVALEEPHLKKKYGKKYGDYLKKIPRWFKIQV